MPNPDDLNLLSVDDATDSPIAQAARQAASGAPAAAPPAAATAPVPRLRAQPVYVNSAGEAAANTGDTLRMMGGQSDAERASMRDAFNRRTNRVLGEMQQANAQPPNLEAGQRLRAMAGPSDAERAAMQARMAPKPPVPAAAPAAPAAGADSGGIVARLRGMLGLGEAGPAPTWRAGLAAQETLPGKALYAAARTAGTVGRVAAPIVSRIGPVAGGLNAMSHFNDYKVNDGIDSSASGTWNYLKQGDFQDTAKSLVKGGAETLMDLGSAAANLADLVVPGKAPVSRAYDKMLGNQFGAQLQRAPEVTAALAPAAPATKPVAPAAARAAAPATSAPAAPAAPPASAARPDPATDMGAAAQQALADGQPQDPSAVYYAQTSADPAGPATYFTRDGRQIVVQPPSAADHSLVQRVSVTEAKGNPGTTFEQDGKQYLNVQDGKDDLGVPVVRAISLDGGTDKLPTGMERSLLQRYDEASRRVAGPSDLDAKLIAAYKDSQQNGQAAAAPAGSQDAPGYAPGAKALIDAALAQEGISGPKADFVRALYQQESGGGRNTGTSNRGAVGGMQVRPATFKGVADPGWDINDPLHNARAGARYASQMYDQAGGDPALAAAGYYGGPRGLAKARAGNAVSDPKNPQAPNTLQYGQQVAARMAALANMASTGASPAARPDPLAGAVQVIDMANDGATHMLVPTANGMVPVSQSMYDAARSALAAQPDLARRVQMTSNGPLLDGALVPPNVLAGGQGAISKFAAAANQGQLYAVNPAQSRIDEERAKEVAHRTPVPGELINNPEEVGIDALGQPIIRNVPYVRGADGSVQRPVPPAPTYQAPPPAAVALLKQSPQMAAQFDAKYGPGAARKVLGK